MSLLFIHAVGALLASAGCPVPLIAYRVCRLRGKLSAAENLAEFEKGRADKILKELHRVQGESEEIIASHRRYIDELRGRIETAEAEIENSKALVAAESEIRISFQNRVYGLEQERRSSEVRARELTAQIENLHQEIDRRQSRLQSLMKLYDEVRSVLSEMGPKRDASGRFVRKSA